MNSGALTGNERRLSRLSYIATLPYEEKQEALRLIMRGIDETLLHFWYNVRSGCYGNLPITVIQTDIEKMRATYPAFEKDINHWTQHLVQKP